MIAINEDSIEFTESINLLTNFYRFAIAINNVNLVTHLFKGMGSMSKRNTTSGCTPQCTWIIHCHTNRTLWQRFHDLIKRITMAGTYFKVAGDISFFQEINELKK